MNPASAPVGRVGHCVVAETPACIRGCDSLALSSIDSRGLRYCCRNCGFLSPEIRHHWSEVSVTAMVAELQLVAPDINARSAQIWAFDAKYGHPSYMQEKVTALDHVRRAIHTACASKSQRVDALSVLSVGCNDGTELDALSEVWSPQSSLGVDLSRRGLRRAMQRHSGLTCVLSSIEELNSGSIDLNGATIERLYGGFNAFLALRVLQSRYINELSALRSIKRAMGPSGWGIIGVPRWKFRRFNSVLEPVERPNALRELTALTAASDKVWDSMTSRIQILGNGKDPMHYLILLWGPNGG